jgi:hypothetical protein
MNVKPLEKPQEGRPGTPKNEPGRIPPSNLLRQTEDERASTQIHHLKGRVVPTRQPNPVTNRHGVTC